MAEESKASVQLPAIGKSRAQGYSDNEVFRMMTAEQNAEKPAKIWDKKTASCRNPLRRCDIKTSIDDKYIPANKYNPRDKKMIEDALEIINNRRKNKDLGSKKEVIGEILEQKKEMFLVTMTHGIIEQQIYNLKKQASDRKKDLEDSKSLLEKDIKKFESYKEKYEEDTKRAEQELEQQIQNRKLKEQEIKSKTILVNSLRTEQNRNQDNIQAYEKYKISLDQLLPKEVVEEKQKRKKQFIAQLRQTYYNRWWQEEHKQSKKIPPQKRQEYEKRFNQALKDDEIEQLDEFQNEEKLYFKEPQQLIQLFNGLEEDSLFCMQNARIASESYQQLKVEFTEKKAMLQTKYKSLMESKTQMLKQLADIDSQTQALLKKKEQNNSNINERDNKDIKLLIETEYLAVKEYMPNLIPEGENNTALVLLSYMETYMERLLEKLIEASMEHPKQIKDIRSKIEKKKNSDKKDEIANQNMKEDEKRKQENKDKKEAVAKVQGRIDMARSAPKDKIKVKKPTEDKNPFDQDKKYLVE